MARKKGTGQKQKQKQTVSQRQQVTQKVIVQVPPARKRRTKKGGSRTGGGAQVVQQQPMFIPQQPLQPITSPFLEQTAMDMNRRLGMFGEEISALREQQKARMSQDEMREARIAALSHARPSEQQPVMAPMIPKSESPEPLILYKPPPSPVSPFIHPAPIDSAFRPVMESKGKAIDIPEGPRMSLADYQDMERQMGMEMLQGSSIDIPLPQETLGESSTAPLSVTPKPTRGRRPKVAQSESERSVTPVMRRSKRIAEMNKPPQNPFLPNPPRILFKTPTAGGKPIEL